jgi:outer membrane protein
MKKVIVFAVATIVLTSAAFAEPKFGVFDAQEVTTKVEEGKKATSSLEKEFNDKKKQVENKGKELEKMKKDLDSQTLVLSKDAMEKKKKEFQDAVIDFQKLQMEAQKDMQQRELTLTNDIFKKINDIIQKMGKDGNYDFIFEKNQGAVTYFKSGDLTQQVIAEYNKMYPVKK